jgi:hypothetical protein
MVGMITACALVAVGAAGTVARADDASRGPTEAVVQKVVEGYAAQLQAGYLSKLPQSGSVAGLSSRVPASQTALARRLAGADVKLLTSAGSPIVDAQIKADSVTNIERSGDYWTVDVSLTTVVDQGADGEGLYEPASWTDTHRLRLDDVDGTWAVTQDNNLPAPSEALPDGAESWPSPADLGIKPAVSAPSSKGKTATSSGPVVAPMSAFPTETKIDGDKFRSYALKWTASPYDGDDKSDFNSVYPYVTNNCANFASQTLDQGGWYLTGGNSLQVDDVTKWTYNLAGVEGPTRTWTYSRRLLTFALNTGTYSSAPYYNAGLGKGDLLFADWEGPAGLGKPDGEVDHTMVVTGFAADNGEPLISQKTNNRHHIRISKSIQLAKDQGRYPIVWYALKHK